MVLYPHVSVLPTYFGTNLEIFIISGVGIIVHEAVPLLCDYVTYV
jgi:hypothetical protein